VPLVDGVAASPVDSTMNAGTHTITAQYVRQAATRAEQASLWELAIVGTLG
jgi:hypothetical protein